MRTRTGVRTAVVLGTVSLMSLLTSCGSTVIRDDGDDPGPPLSLTWTLLIFVALPLATFALLALLVYLPSMSGGPRYRPGLGWWAAPVWFGGPAAAEPAITRAEPTTDGGGASARW